MLGLHGRRHRFRRPGLVLAAEGPKDIGARGAAPERFELEAAERDDAVRRFEPGRFPPGLVDADEAAAVEGREDQRVAVVDGGVVVSRAAGAGERRSIEAGRVVRGSSGGGGRESMRDDAVGEDLKRKESCETKQERPRHFPGCAAKQLLVRVMRVS